MKRTVVAKITLSEHAEIQIGVQEQGGRTAIDVRRYELGAGPARVFMPTKDGLTVPVAEIALLIDALEAAEMNVRAARIER